jgi:hypothetical protein
MSKSNSKSTFRPIAPKSQEPIREPDVIAVVTFTPPEIQEITAPTTDTLKTVTTKALRRIMVKKQKEALLRKKQAGMIQIQDYC